MTAEKTIEMLKRDCHRYQLSCDCESPENCSDCYITEAIKCVEKQISKKSKIIQEGGVYEPTTAQCPVCGELLMDVINNFCGVCGQAIDWSEEE